MLTKTFGEVPVPLYLLKSSTDYPGIRPVSVTGSNPDIDPGAIETVWSHGGLYDFPTQATVMTVASNNVADVGIPVFISGVDENYEEIQEVVVVMGTTPVVSLQSFFRCNLAMNVGPTSPAGIVTGVIDSKVVFTFDGATNKSNQAVYTVPAGQGCFIGMVILGCLKKDVVSINMTFRKEGGSKIVMPGLFMYESTISFNMEGLLMEEKTDITTEIEALNVNNAVSAHINITLVDKTWGDFVFGG